MKSLAKFKACYKFILFELDMEGINKLYNPVFSGVD